MAKSDPQKGKKKAAKKVAVKKAAKKTNPFSKLSLVALEAETSTPADVRVDFFSGLGQVTVALFRRGVMINMQSISSSGSVHLSEVQRGDSVALNGECAGTATIRVSIPTNPSTPENCDAGLILKGYTIR